MKIIKVGRMVVKEDTWSVAFSYNCIVVPEVKTLRELLLLPVKNFIGCVSRFVTS